MCGIACIVSNSDNTEIIDNMMCLMEHRGRDSRNIYTTTYNDKTIHLGHNRLSINDVSENGNQPMHYNDISLVVNGEVWNYKELRIEYESRGYTFKSNSDSEIILYLYVENELNRLDGMFSFIIYDIDKIIISRDWVGKIPLYISFGSEVYIASELKSFPDNIKINAKFVTKNSLITINIIDNTMDIIKDYYFKFSDKPTIVKTHEEVGKKTYELLDTAVKKRMLSDVPIATINSGGIDSSIITYLASQYIKDITSYTINFDEKSEDLAMARLLSERNGIKLVEIVVPKDDDLMKQRFLDVIETIEYPLTVQVEVGILCSFMAEQISNDGFKVVFSGEGSDEAYGSYGMLRMFSKKPDWSDIRKALFEKQYYGNLLRGNNIFMKYGTIEMRTPFFDTEFLNYTTNLSNDFTSEGSKWKFPLVNAFKGKLPDEILYQAKRAFQKGTNFKGYIENIILNDSEINFNNRKNILHVIRDHHKNRFGMSSTEIRKPLTSTTRGLYQWI
jgi:asparagine synthase (glutamine-hydrolysing)